MQTTQALLFQFLFENKLECEPPDNKTFILQSFYSSLGKGGGGRGVRQVLGGWGKILVVRVQLPLVRCRTGKGINSYSLYRILKKTKKHHFYHLRRAGPLQHALQANLLRATGCRCSAAHRKRGTTVMLPCVWGMTLFIEYKTPT